MVFALQIVSQLHHASNVVAAIVNFKQEYYNMPADSKIAPCPFCGNKKGMHPVVWCLKLCKSFNLFYSGGFMKDIYNVFRITLPMIIIFSIGALFWAAIIFGIIWILKIW